MAAAKRAAALLSYVRVTTSFGGLRILHDEEKYVVLITTYRARIGRIFGAMTRPMCYSYYLLRAETMKMEPSDQRTQAK